MNAIRNEEFMKMAWDQAKNALKIKEVPVGCVVIKDGEVLARSFNLTNIDSDPLAHAELNAIKELVKKCIDLKDLTFYITIEPCAMCHGILERIGSKVYFGYENEIFGAKKILNAISGECIKNEECIQILKTFYEGINDWAPVEKRNMKRKIRN